MFVLGKGGRGGVPSSAASRVYLALQRGLEFRQKLLKDNSAGNLVSLSNTVHVLPQTPQIGIMHTIIRCVGCGV